MSYCHYPSPIGDLILTEKEGKLSGVLFSLPEDSLEKEEKDNPVLKKTASWLDDYFKGKQPSQPLPDMTLEVNPFRKKVYEILLEIPFGKVITYGDIAKRIEKESGKRMSAQAVGQAVGSNPIAILIPCHRVIGSKGKLTGYAGGLDKKILLLKNEGFKVEENQVLL